MKRICLMGAAVAGLFSAGITSAAAAATPAKSRTKTVKVKSTVRKVRVDVTCRLALTTQIPTGSTAVTQGTTTGDQYGTAGCRGPLSAGVAHDSFSANDAGALSGPVQQWFRAGAVYGKYTLTPSQPAGPPTTTTFATESYAGTITVTGGTGGLRGATGRGTMSCMTNDGLHYACSETLKLSQTVRTLTVKVGRS